jgi:hypothetical protein
MWPQLLDKQASGRTAVWGQPRHRVSKTPPQPIKIWTQVACVCHSRDVGSIHRRLEVQASMGINASMAPMVEQLPRKLKALNSNPSPTQKIYKWKPLKAHSRPQTDKKSTINKETKEEWGPVCITGKRFQINKLWAYKL